ncbi:MAG TPA: DNA translocase FtsK 4TM domain-containing protein [Acidimicrobiia bacterium]|jgi:S-DNA-T family DNA segregation ATPase FtsK/SpoIIIE
MPTRTSTRSRTASTRRRAASKKPAPRRSSRRAAEPTLRVRASEAARRELGGHAADAAAVGLLVLAALLVLGLAGDLAGAVGTGLADGIGSLLGRARYALPVVLVVFAILLFSLRSASAVEESDEETDDPESEPPREPTPLRVGVGFALVFVAAVGFLHLTFDRPPIDGSLDALRDAGGVLGAIVGGSLGAAAGTVGAVIVLTGVAVLGALLAPGVPMHGVITGLGRGARWLGGQARAHARRAGELGAGDAEQAPADAASPAAASDAVGPEVEPAFVDLYDIDLEADTAESAFIDDSPTLTDLAPVAVPPTVEESDGQVALDLGPKAGPRRGAWKLPPKGTLKRGDTKPADRGLVEEGGRILAAALHQHGVDARLVGTTVGPTVTRYELELAAGVKVSRVTTLSHDIAYAMASPDVRILAPIPGRSAIGVEVPNKARQLVTLGDILASPEAKAATGALEVGLGRDIAGRAVMLDLSALPHVLIAGATGAGKSSCINSLVTSLLMRNTPEQVRLILVDPKRVELGGYNDIPHLLTPVVTNPKKAANALDWAVREMDLRYDTLSQVGARDIGGFNAMVDRGELPSPDEPDVHGKGYERLPFIVVVVDELNDLMMVAARDVEASICRIAQMARAVGIHLVIATQRPSVDVITGVIKANIPSRLAFSVSSLADSRVILDQAGAEKLIGMGDLLMVTASSSRPQRIQGAWVDEECIRNVAAHWKRQAAEPHYVAGVADDTEQSGGRAGGDADDDDPLLVEAMELVVRSGLGSTSMLQRKLRVGFARAGRIMDLLERKGVVGPSTGSKARDVLMSVEEFEAIPRVSADSPA